MTSARALALRSLVLGPMAVAACTGGVASPPEGSGPAPARAQVIFEGRLESGTGDGCESAGPLFGVGVFGDGASPAQPIKHGETFEQGTVSVTCSVTSSGTGEHEVVGDLALSGAGGGRFRVAGTFETTGEQSGVRAMVTDGRTDRSYEQADCTVSYATGFQGVAPGRIWGEVDCPVAVNATNETSCRLVAQFRFENCAQE